MLNVIGSGLSIIFFLKMTTYRKITVTAFESPQYLLGQDPNL